MSNLRSKTVVAIDTKLQTTLTKEKSDLSCSVSSESERPPVKKLPPIKAPVGLAKGPDLKNCKSKIGSLNNIKHTPTGGRITIPSQKLKWNAQSKVGSLENKEHKPGGGKLKVETQKLNWKTTSKVQSLQNVHHKPGGGNVKIFNESYVPDKSTSVKKSETNTSDSDASNSSSSKNNANPQCSKGLTKDLKDLKLKE